jgi:hypothetical protein
LGRPQKNPPFWRRVALFSFVSLNYAPPPLEDIIITTTIMTVAKAAITLYILFFCIEGCMFGKYTSAVLKNTEQPLHTSPKGRLHSPLIHQSKSQKIIGYFN